MLWPTPVSLKVVRAALLLRPYSTARRLSEGARRCSEGTRKSIRDSQKALAVMGWVKGRYDWNPSAAEDTLRKAVALNPNYARARQALAEVLVATARGNDADAEMARALELEPLSLSINAAVGLIAYFGRQYHKAIECFRQTIELDPTFYPAHWYLAWAYEQIGQLSEGEAELREAQALSHDNTLVIASLSGIYAAAGRANEARTILAEWKICHRKNTCLSCDRCSSRPSWRSRTRRSLPRGGL